MHLHICIHISLLSDFHNHTNEHVHYCIQLPFFCVWWEHLRTLSKFQVYNTVLLTIVTKLYIISPEFIHLIIGSLYLLIKNSLFIYSYREGKGGRKRGKETSVCGFLSCTPHWGPGMQPRRVPWLGIKPAILWFTGPCSIHWATPARKKFVPFDHLHSLSTHKWEHTVFVFLHLTYVT